jgi:hypothetical protein
MVGGQPRTSPARVQAKPNPAQPIGAANNATGILAGTGPNTPPPLPRPATVMTNRSIRQRCL